MFHFTNQQFLLSFGAANDDTPLEPSPEQSFPSNIKNQCKQLPSTPPTKQQNFTSKNNTRQLHKFSLNSCFPKSRRMSGDTFHIRQMDVKNQRQQQAKSSASAQKRVQNQVIVEVESGRSAKSQSYQYDISEAEGSFMKKIRNLETRIKNMDLNYRTHIIKMKQQNQKLTKQNIYIRDFIVEKCPQVAQELQKYLQKCVDKEQSDSFYSSSSQSNKSDDELMPIMSKIQQLKIDGGKMSDTIKNYQEILIKKQQLQQQIQKQKIREQQQSRTNSRKYSIPIQLQRQKKQSFNDPYLEIPLIQQGEFSNSNVQSQRNVKQLSLQGNPPENEKHQFQ